MKTPRVGLVGISGYGAVHLQHLLQLQAAGEIQVVAVVVYPSAAGPAVPAELRQIGCTLLNDFPALLAQLARLQLDLCIVPTPIHLHARMTIALLERGVNVLVEKPVAATLEEVAEIERASAANGRWVAVGFQYLHAPEVVALKQQLLSGAIGELRRIHVYAAWPRSHQYYRRNDWAGRLKVDGHWVLDSPVNNAMSHFLMLMLYLSGGELESLAEPVQLSAELYRAQAIESFDTAVLHLTSASGCRLDFYGTHSSRKLHRPTLQIEGSSGRGEWEQDSHAALSRFDGTEWCQAAQAEANTRERMLRAVLALARGQPAFVCSPRQAAAHVRCVEALHRSVSITPLDPASLDHHQDPAGVDQFTFVPDIEAALRAGADRGLHLHALGVSWAVPPSAATLP